MPGNRRVPRACPYTCTSLFRNCGPAQPDHSQGQAAVPEYVEAFQPGRTVMSILRTPRPTNLVPCQSACRYRLPCVHLDCSSPGLITESVLPRAGVEYENSLGVENTRCLFNKEVLRGARLNSATYCVNVGEIGSDILAKGWLLDVVRLLGNAMAQGYVVLATMGPNASSRIRIDFSYCNRHTDAALSKTFPVTHEGLVWSM